MILVRCILSELVMDKIVAVKTKTQSIYERILQRWIVNDTFINVKCLV